MELLKKLVWGFVFILLVGGLLYGAILIRNSISAKNYSDFWQERSFDGGDFTYVVMGDSTALGIGTSTIEKSYPYIIKERIRETGRSVKLLNLATKDANIPDVIYKQLPKIVNFKPDLITITVGMEDINSGIDPDAYAKNITTLFTSLPSQVSYFAELPSVYDDSKDKIIQERNRQMAEIAKQNNINIVPLYEATRARRYDIAYYAWDFVHPSDSGYALWADTFWNSIQQ